MKNKKLILISVVVIIIVVIILAVILPNMLDSGNNNGPDGDQAKEYTATFDHWQSGTEQKVFEPQEGETESVPEDTGGNVYSGTFTLTWEDDNTLSPDEFTLTVTPLDGSVDSYDPSDSVTSSSGFIQIKVYIMEPPPETYIFQANSTNDAEEIVHDLYDIPNMNFNIDIHCNGDDSPLDTGNEVTFNNYYNGFTIESVIET